MSQRRSLRPLFVLEAWLEAPMFLLALAWLWLFLIELSRGLTNIQQWWAMVIWLLFIAEFALKLALAPRKWRYLKVNWLTAVALVIPAFRTLRLLRALRLLRGTRALSTVRFVRALTSTRRLVTEWREAQGSAPGAEMNIGILLTCSASADTVQMEQFAQQLARDVRAEVEDASGLPWHFHPPRFSRLENDDPRGPANFLNVASRHMAAGSYDVVLVITDVGLVSRRQQPEAGLVSPVTRTLVISTEILAGGGRSQRNLQAAEVRWNAAALLLHLLGHVAGLRHRSRQQSEVMQPFVFRELRQNLPRFTDKERQHLRRQSRRLPERELRGGGPLASLIFHSIMMARHPRALLLTLLRSRSLLLPLALPGLATAAVVPALLLVFNAEIWDVGLNMSSATTTIFASTSILVASFYLIQVQSLFFPRKEKRTVTEHLAVANGVVFLSIVFACLGLFLMVGSLILLVQLYIFPADLMQTWPTLDVPDIVFTDQLRLAAFISTIGTVTGALAGGFENRAVIQHLALFEDGP